MSDNEKQILIAATKMCSGVYIEGDKVLASINVNGYEKLYNRYASLVNTLKNWVSLVREHKETHNALGV
jgi:hypothetical protein